MHARFGLGNAETPIDYGLAIFCSLNFFNLCGEAITRSPRLIVLQPNLVKKVVFPAGDPTDCIGAGRLASIACSHLCHCLMVAIAHRANPLVVRLAAYAI